MKKQLCSILIVFLCLLCLSSCSESAKFESYVKNGDYAEAIEYYNSEIYGNTKSEAAASTFLSTYLNEQYDAYAEGSLSDTDFQAALDTVSNINDSCVIFSSDEVDTIW